MPQMAPISWLLLFIIFSITLIIFNTLNYFSFLPSTPNLTQSEKKNNISMNWKW
uniref:ATP synthase F0 subunit 8 n=1 Tax=Pselliophora bifascipennis TaxID=3081712 RepID=UPI002A7F3D66|nr:ATP synthase F0 subunit 8 [Pselliophora bifascipennis]WOE90376.1 ATP synthase F0 subunit 8 [Pselliophora bifascipennis]